MLNLYPLLYKNGKYNFIYRPIDINNPFPNRNAGINWFDWYAISENVERLESAYDRLQYSVTLDNQTITQIKKYNKQQNSNGGYFDWNTMNNDKSSFVDDYFEIKRQNIVGDNS